MKEQMTDGVNLSDGYPLLAHPSVEGTRSQSGSRGVDQNPDGDALGRPPCEDTSEFAPDEVGGKAVHLHKYGSNCRAYSFEHLVERRSAVFEQVHRVSADDA